MHRDPLSVLLATVGADATPEVLSRSMDGRLVAAFGPMVAKLGLPGEAQRTATIMEAVLSALGPHSVLVVPRVLWVRGDVLAMQRLAGESYRTLVPGEHGAVAMRMAGEAIAALHAMHPPALRPCTVGDHISDLIRPQPVRLGQALPELAERIDAILRRVTADHRPLAGEGVLHRDLHLGQMLAIGERVAVVDWDLAAIGDPALDLGNLRAYLCTRLPAVAARLWDAFVDGYGDALPVGIDRFESLMYLRMASKAYRLNTGAAAEEITSLVAAAEACW